MTEATTNARRAACCSFLLFGALCVVTFNQHHPDGHDSLRHRRLQQGWGPAQSQHSGLMDPRTVEMKPAAWGQAPPGGAGFGVAPPQQAAWAPLPDQQQAGAGFGGSPPLQASGGFGGTAPEQAGGGFGGTPPGQAGAGFQGTPPLQASGGFGGAPPGQASGGFGGAPPGQATNGDTPPVADQTGLWGSLPDQQQSSGPPPVQSGGWGGAPPIQQQQGSNFQQQGGWEQGTGPPLPQQQAGGWGGTPPNQQASGGPAPVQQQAGFGGTPLLQGGPPQGSYVEPRATFSQQASEAFQHTAPQPKGSRTVDPKSPSHVQLCTEFLNRREYNNGYQPSELFVVRESKRFCTSPDTFLSLVNMMVSAMVAQAGSMWRLSYQHGCETTTDLTTATVQQMMPNDLTLAMGAGIEAVTEICKKALSDETDLKKDGFYAFGFPKEGLYNIDPALNANRATAFRHNIYAAVSKINRLERKLHVPPVNQGAVIYMDLQSEEIPTHKDLPPDYYLSKIPQFAPAVSIVVSPACQTSPDCVNYSTNLQGSLQTTMSGIPVTMEQVPSTSVAMARIMDAPILVCPPSMMCLLPALWKPVQQTTSLSHSPEMYPWFQYMVREAKKSFHLGIEYEKKE